MKITKIILISFLGININLPQSLAQPAIEPYSHDPYTSNDSTTPFTIEPKQGCLYNQNLPSVEMEGMNNLKSIPWSSPVLFKDSFLNQGVLAVFDREYNGSLASSLRTAEQGVITVWSTHKITAIFYGAIGGHLKYGIPASTIIVKINEQLFPLEKQDTAFLISDEMATLLNSVDNDKVSVRVINSTETRTYRIGQATIAAWKQIYAMKQNCF